MSRRIELFLAACLYYSGLIALARWWTQRSRQHLVILCYHNADGRNLRQQLRYLRRHYRILHLEEALEGFYAPSTRKKQKRGRTPLVLTFDDGYQDNYTYAFALARELRVPFTIFLVPGYIESGHCFWWQEDKRLLSYAQVDEVTVEGHTYCLDKVDESKALAQVIDTRVRYATSVVEREKFLAGMRKVLIETAPVFAEEKTTLPLTWAQVQTMKESGWVSFGAHTMHHPILACLTAATEVQYEVSQCRTVLERHLNYPVRTFAYPIGQLEDIGDHGLHAVQKANYSWALTTIGGFNTLQTNPYLLRRIVVDVDQHWLQVAAKASGIWGALSHLYWKYGSYHASIFASASVSFGNFANRFFFKFSRNIQVISASFQEAHSRINAKPCSGSATVTTLTV